MRGLSLRYGFVLTTLCSIVPETQTSALAEGLTVRNQFEMYEAETQEIPVTPYEQSSASVELPPMYEKRPQQETSISNTSKAKFQMDDDILGSLLKKPTAIRNDIFSLPTAGMEENSDYFSGLEGTTVLPEQDFENKQNQQIPDDFISRLTESARQEESIAPEEQLQAYAQASEASLKIVLDDGTRQSIQLPQEVLTETLLYQQNLRSGQVLEAKGNVVLVGDAHSGSEIIAGGDIVVWGTLSGIAHAGAHGRMQSIIRAFRIEALQLRIGNTIARRPDKLFKKEVALTRANSDVMRTETARIIGQEIQVQEDLLRV